MPLGIAATAAGGWSVSREFKEGPNRLLHAAKLSALPQLGQVPCDEHELASRLVATEGVLGPGHWQAPGVPAAMLGLQVPCMRAPGTRGAAATRHAALRANAGRNYRAPVEA